LKYQIESCKRPSHRVPSEGQKVGRKKYRKPYGTGSSLASQLMEKKVKSKYNAIIIGSGIIGCSIAFELSKKGWKTLNSLW
jgi:hypothetical protein